MNGQTLGTIIVLAAVAGCKTPPPRQINFDSDPPGARVFYGMHANPKIAEPRTYIGTTPLTWTPKEQDGGEFEFPRVLGYSKFVPPAIVFEGRPPGDCSNCTTQRVIFRGPALGRDADPMPEGVFFDLRPKK